MILDREMLAGRVKSAHKLIARIRMKNIFTEHPHSIGESYFEHFCFAFKFGAQMVIGGLACILNAIFPFLFKKTASNYLLKMTHEFVSRIKVVDERAAKIADVIQKKMHN